MVMEIGKKYTHPSASTIYDCVAKTPNGDAVVMYQLSDKSWYSSIISKTSFKSYDEYKEPMKGEAWVNVYSIVDAYEISKIHYGNPSTRELCDEYARNTDSRIACVRIPWTEGEGL